MFLGPFDQRFLTAIQIRWKLRLAAIPLRFVSSQQMFAHATTAQLSCHVQNFVAVTVLESRGEWNEISIESSNCDGKTVSETGPWFLWDTWLLCKHTLLLKPTDIGIIMNYGSIKCMCIFVYLTTAMAPVTETIRRGRLYISPKDIPWGL